MYRIKIHGAGSIGNHLSHAARQLGWDVTLCDISDQALERARTHIYPTRYGNWDAEIKLFNSLDAPRGGYDIILIGTPPEHHMPLALSALDENPRAVQVEKPLCTPDLKGAQELFKTARDKNIAVFVGYDHVVGAAIDDASEKLRARFVGEIETLDVEFREHWGGIFAAHPWLSGPVDSYLGFWKRGGGASGEHSHALNLWQHFAHVLNAGRVIEVSALVDYVRTNRVDYDKLCAFNLTCESGLAGRVAQDVITRPVRKWARIQGQNGFIEWHCGVPGGGDELRSMFFGEEPETRLYKKTRPDDFIAELKHIQHALTQGTTADSPISLERGLDTMLVVAAAHLSAQERRCVKIDYSAGYQPQALSV